MTPFEWWFDLSPWTRAVIGVVFLLISTVLWFSGLFWPYGWVVGAILLLLSFPSDSEKKGYHF